MGKNGLFFFRKVGKEIYYHRKKLNDVITTTSYYIVSLLDYLTGCDPQCFMRILHFFRLSSKLVSRVSSLYDVQFSTPMCQT